MQWAGIGSFLYLLDAPNRMQGLRSVLLFSLVVAAALAGLSGCRSGIPDGRDGGGNSPDLSGDFLAGFAWERTATGPDLTTFTGRDGDVILKLSRFDDMGSEEAASYISSKLFVIDSLYREMRSPYPGALSNRIGCAEEFKPATIENSSRRYHLLYATDRLTYGACSWDLIAYRAILSFLHCEKSNALYQIEIFVPREGYTALYEESLIGLSCPSAA